MSYPPVAHSGTMEGSLSRVRRQRFADTHSSSVLSALSLHEVQGEDRKDEVTMRRRKTMVIVTGSSGLCSGEVNWAATHGA